MTRESLSIPNVWRNKDRLRGPTISNCPGCGILHSPAREICPDCGASREDAYSLLASVIIWSLTTEAKLKGQVLYRKK